MSDNSHRVTKAFSSFFILGTAITCGFVGLSWVNGEPLQISGKVVTGFIIAAFVFWLLWSADLHHLMSHLGHFLTIPFRLVWIGLGYLYDVFRKLSDRNYVIVKRPLVGTQDEERERASQMRELAGRLRAEAAVKEAQREHRLARGKLAHLRYDLERRRQDAEDRMLHGDPLPPEEEERRLKTDMLRHQLDHQLRIQDQELASMRPLSDDEEQRLNPTREDNDDVIY